MVTTTRFAFRSLVLGLLIAASTAQAQWQLDGAPVSTAMGDQWIHAAIADGAGGAFITWMDGRNGSWGNHLLYIQRIDAYGNPLWTPDGVALTTVPEQSDPKLVADGAGGVIVCWNDSRSGVTNIYAQRVSGSGVAQWTANGVPICTEPMGQYWPAIDSDGTGGAIIMWSDWRSGFADIYAQRVNASGSVQWTTNGVPVCTAASGQFEPKFIADGAGGAIVTWYDLRNGNYDVYVQRVNAAGASQWAANGVALSTDVQQQSNGLIVAAGSGGAIVAWRDQRSGVDFDLYAQRVSASGTLQWAAGGVALCAGAGDQNSFSITSDNAGGVMAAWEDFRNGSHLDIFAQRINSAGTAMWVPNGVPVCAATNHQYVGSIVGDGEGGAIVPWHDARSGGFDIYVQRINASGAMQWATDGVPLSTATSDQVYPIVVSGGAESAIVTWYDWRAGNGDMYAQRIEFAEQYWGHPEPVVASVADIPGDQGGKVKVNWMFSGWDVRHYNTITHYSIWRATEFEPAAAQLVSSADDIGPDFSGVAFRREVDAAGDEYYWEWVGNQNAIYSPRYSFSADTRSDSTSQGASDHYFQVLAHTWNNFVFWASNVMSGHSVDNLAPAAPLMLTAQRVGRDVELRWNRSVAPDVRDYAIYRASASGVTPMPINFLSASDDTVLVDHNTPVSTLYYVVTATDMHENRSAPSNEASVQKLTGIGDAPSITALTVLQNHPNPFGASTELEVGLPRESDVSIQVYDVAGRLVRSETRSRMSAGWQRVALDARGGDGKPLASGVYFYRVSANGSTVTKKMVIAR